MISFGAQGSLAHRIKQTDPFRVLGGKVGHSPCLRFKVYHDLLDISEQHPFWLWLILILAPQNYSIRIFTHLKLCPADAIHIFK